MDVPPRGPDSRPFDPNQPEGVEEALLRWDELSPHHLAILAAHPSAGPKLALLRQAEEHLTGRQAAAPGPDCPSVEELYDYGHGPGYRPLTAQRRRAIDRHLTHCSACEGAVETLASPPPVPLDAAPLEVEPHAGPMHAGALGVTTPVSFGGFDPAEIQSAPRERRPGSLQLNSQAADDNSTRANPTRADNPTDASQEASELQAFGERVAALPLRRFWVPLAAAAGVLVFGMTWRIQAGGDSLPRHFPDAPLLRGEAGGNLLWPRDRVLLPRAGDERFAWAANPVLELKAVDGASSYRIELMRHDGGAFAEGQTLYEATGSEPRFDLKQVLDSQGRTPELSAGNYTWEAWVQVSELDRPLGSRDFQIVADEDTWAAVDEFDSRPEPERSESLLRVLHEAGYLNDARSFARSLAPSAERDAYLSQQPAR